MHQTEATCFLLQGERRKKVYRWISLARLQSFHFQPRRHHRVLRKQIGAIPLKLTGFSFSELTGKFRKENESARKFLFFLLSRKHKTSNILLGVCEGNFCFVEFGEICSTQNRTLWGLLLGYKQVNYPFSNSFVNEPERNQTFSLSTSSGNNGSLGQLKRFHKDNWILNYGNFHFENESSCTGKPQI